MLTLTYFLACAVCFAGGCFMGYDWGWKEGNYRGRDAVIKHVREALDAPEG